MWGELTHFCASKDDRFLGNAGVIWVGQSLSGFHRPAKDSVDTRYGYPAVIRGLFSSMLTRAFPVAGVRLRERLLGGSHCTHHVYRSDLIAPCIMPVNMQHSAWVAAGLIHWARIMKTVPWVSLEDIAERLKVSTDTIHQWIRAKKIPVHRVGRVWRFKVTEVDAWVRAGNAGTGRDVRDDSVMEK